MSKHSIRGAQWERVRRYAIVDAGRKCQRCGRAGRLEVHHRVPIAKGGAPFHPWNLEVICRRCHFDAHREESRQRGRERPVKREMDPARLEWMRYISG